jgi:hypothetical protein
MKQQFNKGDLIQHTNQRGCFGIILSVERRTLVVDDSQVYRYNVKWFKYHSKDFVSLLPNKTYLYTAQYLKLFEEGTFT